MCAVARDHARVSATTISLTSLVSGVSLRVFQTILALINALGMAVVVEFIWTVQGFRDRRFLWLARALCVLTGATEIAFLARLDAGKAEAAV